MYYLKGIEMKIFLELRELRTPRVAGGMQVYSVTNYSTCCFLLHLQLFKNYIKELSGLQRTLTTDKQTDNNCDLVI